MNKINTNIRIISPDGSDFAYFTEKDELYSQLSGIKDHFGDDMEFIEIGKKIFLDEKTLIVKDINIKFENINNETKHITKNKNKLPPNLIIDVIITVENLPFKI